MNIFYINKACINCEFDSGSERVCYHQIDISSFLDTPIGLYAILIMPIFYDRQHITFLGFSSSSFSFPHL